MFTEKLSKGYRKENMLMLLTMIMHAFTTAMYLSKLAYEKMRLFSNVCFRKLDVYKTKKYTKNIP